MLKILNNKGQKVIKISDNGDVNVLSEELKKEFLEEKVLTDEEVEEIEEEKEEEIEEDEKDGE